MRTNGVIGNSILLFTPSKLQQATMAETVANFGLILHPSETRSIRMCKVCVSVVDRLAKDLVVFRKWQEEEKAFTEKTTLTPVSSEGRDKRPRSPSSLTLPLPVPKKPCNPQPGRTRKSVTQVQRTKVRFSWLQSCHIGFARGFAFVKKIINIALLYIINGGVSVYHLLFVVVCTCIWNQTRSYE
ncbi:hypothetical protein NL108_011896 [Boleophthalmus pectinirostris]|nr:hypothetical protein NL108_011896 [Boleophthalmus pectinirostris]